MLAACGSNAPSPIGSNAAIPAGSQSAANSAASPAPPDVVAGPWQTSPIPLADSQVAIVSDACAAAARAQLGEVEAQLPTAVVDARGDSRFVAVLSDGGVGIDCIGRVTEAGATVTAVDRLAVESVAPVEGSATAITELAGLEDSSTSTMAFGRSGPAVTGVRIGFGDASSVIATRGDGWWAAWWPGSKRAMKVESLDANGAVTATTTPNGEVESRLVTATWWLDPASPPPAAGVATLKVLVRENACASGTSGAERVDPPDMAFSETSITVRVDIRRGPGGQDCQGTPPFRFTLELPEPVGGRALLDASTRPPRDATKPPADS
jgi:hypothetical protein